MHFIADVTCSLLCGSAILSIIAAARESWAQILLAIPFNTEPADTPAIYVTHPRLNRVSDRNPAAFPPIQTSV